jgi:protein transport protein SEC31
MLKTIERTSITCWSPADEQEPLLALGTVSGALDASFSSKTELEIVGLDLASPTKEMKKLASVPCNARY